MSKSPEASPAFQWYPKQFLGDDKVLAMDWDAVGMHIWLMNLSWQQVPRGTLPNDLPLIRRWLRSPSDEIWRRVWPQLMQAWTLAGDRLVNAGMVRTAYRQALRSIANTNNIRKRYESDTNNKKYEDEEDPKREEGNAKGGNLEAKGVLAYLNTATGRNFRAVEVHVAFIAARLRDPGVTVEEIQRMIDRQVALWKGTEMEKYLRPETLFNKTKFASYYDDRNQPTAATVNRPKTLIEKESEAALAAARKLQQRL